MECINVNDINAMDHCKVNLLVQKQRKQNCKLTKVNGFLESLELVFISFSPVKVRLLTAASVRLHNLRIAAGFTVIAA